MENKEIKNKNEKKGKRKAKRFWFYFFRRVYKNKYLSLKIWLCTEQKEKWKLKKRLFISNWWGKKI